MDVTLGDLSCLPGAGVTRSSRGTLSTPPSRRPWRSLSRPMTPAGKRVPFPHWVPGEGWDKAQAPTGFFQCHFCFLWCNEWCEL